MIDFEPKPKNWVVGSIIKTSELAGITDWMDIFGWRLGLPRVVIETILPTEHLSSDTVSMVFQTDWSVHED